MERAALRLGVVAVQGDFPDHERALRAALDAEGEEGVVVRLRTAADAEAVHGAVLPGGESTTISKLLVRGGAHDVLRRRGAEGLPLLGTCAGLILLAKEGDAQVRDTGSRLLGLLDVQVDRNAFGRQRESFEADLRLDRAGFAAPVHAVFIRAPAVVRAWGDAKVLARVGERIVAVEQGRLLGLAFHPELTGDARLHRLFVRHARAYADEA